MESIYIWAIDMAYFESCSDIQIEIFSGRNKHTKAGLFSGPLRRQEIDPLIEDDTIRFLFSLDGNTQISKNKFHLTSKAASTLFQYFNHCHMAGVYCRLQDKKLHHVERYIIQSDNLTNRPSLLYDQKDKSLSYCLFEATHFPSVETSRVEITPSPHLYLDAEEKQIRGFLTFLYQGIEVQANSKLEEIKLSTSKVLLRNLRYEREIQQQIYAAGGNPSFKNEVTFNKRFFFSKILPFLQKTELTLYWGARKEKILKAEISCSISYDMDWFSVSGLVTDETNSYDLSKLLRSSRGRTYAELKDGILFLPESLKKISRYTMENGETLVPHKDLWMIHQLAANQQLDSSDYLDRLSNYSEVTLTLGSKWETTLRPYQKNGVAWALNLYQNGFSGCLADDMGLGKTIQAIAFLCARKKHTKSPDLIVSPKIVLFNWINELRRFAPEQRYIVAYGDFDYNNVTEKNVIYLTTYETLLRHSESFSNISYDSVIMDETQSVKNYRTKRYHALKRIHSKFMLALSGTPIENNIVELWSLFNLINPGMLGNRDSFLKTFAPVNEDKKQTERLKKIISPFLLRRTKDAVLKDLPSKEEYHIYCKMEEGQRTLYDALLLGVHNEIDRKPSRYQIKDNAVILQALLYLREACSDPALLPPKLRSSIPCNSCKLELFQEYANRIVPASGKLIVYSLFPRVLRKMESWCQQQNWQTFYIDGTTNNRQQVVEDFEQSAQGVFFISLKAGGLGLNLTSCQYVLIYDPWWNSAAEQQAADRVYRIGQDKPVFIYHFLVENTIEEKIYELQQKKNEISSGVLDGLDQSKGISMEDIYQLLL